MNKGKYRIVALVLAFLLICPFLPVQNAFADGAEDASATQTQTQTQTDPNQWVRVLRDYTGSVEIGNYYYYFSKKVNGSTYKVYRGEKESYKEMLILNCGFPSTILIRFPFTYASGSCGYFPNSTSVIGRKLFA